MSTELIKWITFSAFVLGMLILDLKVFHRQAHEVKLKEALGWSAFWIALALVFNVGLYFWYGGGPEQGGRQAALEFFTGYLIEKSLSVDNLFVFLMLFGYFRVPPKLQHGVLFWGILGALVMRLVFIVVGVWLIQKISWIMLVFGGILVYSGVKMARHQETEVHPENNPLLKLMRRFFPMTSGYVDNRFLVKQAGKWVATPLLAVLVVVESTDVVFAVDSIPAVLAITSDPFIVYTSNVFAILGLRALYFALAGVMDLFHYLNYGLALILVIVGGKMILGYWHIKLPISVALGVVAGILVLSVVASLVWPKKQPQPAPPPVEE
jgi:tellurite resistance protein TerC